MKRIRKLNPQKREAILKAAIDEFDRKGYDACNMDSVAKKADVSKATVYKHFSNKRNLFMVIMMKIKELMDNTYKIVYDKNTSIKSQLLLFTEKELEMLCDTDNMILFRIATRALMQKDKETEALKDQAVDNLYINLEQWFELAKVDNHLNFEDATFVTTQFIGAIKVFAYHPQLLGAKALTKKEQNVVSKSTVDMIIKMYGT